MIEVAKLTANLSTCNRLQVGAVISKDGRPLVSGRNGTIAGLPNDCEEEIEEICSECDGFGFMEDVYMDTVDCKRCDGSGKTKRMSTSDFTVHAEQNAIFYSARNGLMTEGCTIYITHAPCPNCAKAIASAGIKRVVYETKYKDERGIEFLRKCKVEVSLLSD